MNVLMSYLFEWLSGVSGLSRLPNFTSRVLLEKMGNNSRNLIASDDEFILQKLTFVFCTFIQ